jgi:hypothetical protein
MVGMGAYILVGVPVDMTGVDVSNVLNISWWRSQLVVRVGKNKILVILCQQQIKK